MCSTTLLLRFRDTGVMWLYGLDGIICSGGSERTQGISRRNSTAQSFRPVGSVPAGNEVVNQWAKPCWAGSGRLSNPSHPVPAGSSSTLLTGELFLWGNSFLSALSIAAFQKDLAYSPAYPWGTLLALLETLVTSTIFALFLLAIRRQFRR
jgi:hypothetical protein